MEYPSIEQHIQKRSTVTELHQKAAQLLFISLHNQQKQNVKASTLLDKTHFPLNCAINHKGPSVQDINVCILAINPKTISFQSGQIMASIIQTRYSDGPAPMCQNRATWLQQEDTTMGMEFNIV